jgi:hypothetical protein
MIRDISDVPGLGSAPGTAMLHTSLTSRLEFSSPMVSQANTTRYL